MTLTPGFGQGAFLVQSQQAPAGPQAALGEQLFVSGWAQRDLIPTSPLDAVTECDAFLTQLEGSWTPGEHIRAKAHHIGVASGELGNLAALTQHVSLYSQRGLSEQRVCHQLVQRAPVQTSVPLGSQSSLIRGAIPTQDKTILAGASLAHQTFS